MKKVLLIAISVLIGFASEGQYLKYDPIFTQGYLVFNENSSIEKWEVEILKVDYENEQARYSVSEKLDVAKKNYIKIPDYYLNSNNSYKLKIRPIDVNQRVIGDEEIDLETATGGGSELDCSWKCNGRTYAWSINKYSGQSTYLQLGSNVSYVDPNGWFVTPYYQYMKQTEFDNLINDADFLLDHYLIDDPIIDGIKLKKINDADANDGYRNKDGYLLIGTVYGVAKERGYWNGYNIQTSDLAITDGDCGQTMNWAINKMNTYSDDFDQYNLNDLECQTVGGSGGSGGISATTTVIDCDEGFFYWTPGEGDDMYDLVDFIESNCYPDDGDDDGTIGEGGNVVIDKFWPEDLHDFTVARINTSGFYQTFTESDSVSSSGHIVAPVFEMDQGLYNITFRFKDQSFVNKIVEIKEKTINRIEKADLLKVRVFPNPIKSDKFKLMVSSEADLNFTYELIDFYGNVIFTDDYCITKNKKEIIQINPAGGIPYGWYINRFLLDDGSFISIKTSKVIHN